MTKAPKSATKGKKAEAAETGMAPEDTKGADTTAAGPAMPGATPSMPGTGAAPVPEAKAAPVTEAGVKSTEVKTPAASTAAEPKTAAAKPADPEIVTPARPSDAAALGAKPLPATATKPEATLDAKPAAGSTTPSDPFSKPLAPGAASALPKTEKPSEPAKPADSVKPAETPKSAPATPAAKPAAKPAAAEEPRGSSFWPALMGGVIAAFLGAAVVLWVFPEGLRSPSGDPAALEKTVADQRGRITTLESEVAELRSAQPVPEGTAALSDEILSRLSALEAGQGGGAGLDDLRAQVAALSQKLDGSTDLAGAEERIRAAQADAEKLAREAQARAAFSHLQAALDSGAALDGPRADLEAAGVQVPATLAGQVPTLQALRDAFPAAAREGLSASLRATRAQGNYGDRLKAYLQAATGARSLNPREGGDPDAVLSRAEAAVTAGNLPDAIAEIESLPAEGQQAMSDWTAQARIRIAAQEAAAGLATGLN
ncbi:mitofilin family membrane protein [Frigidibacter sp. MR17.14]|uniref:mitofilin family membrane protein n=1 Tax=Frigidibacter sp. MR17.14 TaxID=3126509 RepID=UPI00301302C5